MLPFRIQVAGIEYERIARDLIAALAGGGIGRRFDFEHSLVRGTGPAPKIPVHVKLAEPPFSRLHFRQRGYPDVAFVTFPSRNLSAAAQQGFLTLCGFVGDRTGFGTRIFRRKFQRFADRIDSFAQVYGDRFGQRSALFEFADSLLCTLDGQKRLCRRGPVLGIAAGRSHIETDFGAGYRTCQHEQQSCGDQGKFGVGSHVRVKKHLIRYAARGMPDCIIFMELRLVRFGKLNADKPYLKN